MVLVVNDWEILKEEARANAELPFLYRIDQQDGRARLRLSVGSFGYDRWYDDKAQEFDAILEYLRGKDAISVKEQVSNERFFI